MSGRENVSAGARCEQSDRRSGKQEVLYRPLRTSMSLGADERALTLGSGWRAATARPCLLPTIKDRTACLRMCGEGAAGKLCDRVACPNNGSSHRTPQDTSSKHPSRDRTELENAVFYSCTLRQRPHVHPLRRQHCRAGSALPWRLGGMCGRFLS